MASMFILLECLGEYLLECSHHDLRKPKKFHREELRFLIYGHLSEHLDIQHSGTIR